jgi:hypothetical protein
LTFARFAYVLTIDSLVAGCLRRSCISVRDFLSDSERECLRRFERTLIHVAIEVVSRGSVLGELVRSCATH